MFSISNCKTSIRPDRVELIDQLSSYFPTDSFGRCLGSYENYAQDWNSHRRYGSKQHLEEMAEHLFVYAPENSFGIDYITEKVYHPLIRGAVPIYMGPPNIHAFLPHRDAAIHISDFASVKDLGNHLKRLSQNITLLVERHHAWRTKSLPDWLTGKLAKLVDKKSDSYMCKVCNCFRGRIGCPDF